jgi:hypothetical protein
LPDRCDGGRRPVPREPASTAPHDLAIVRRCADTASSSDKTFVRTNVTRNSMTQDRAAASTH